MPISASAPNLTDETPAMAASDPRRSLAAASRNPESGPVLREALSSAGIL